MPRLRLATRLSCCLEEWPEGGRFSAETLGQSAVELLIRVDDVDSFAARAVAAGMTVSRPIKDQFYGSREGSFVDPFGYTWNILTVKEEMSAEEMYRRFNAMQARAKKPEVNPIPRGFRTVTPYLVAEDGPALLEFAKQAFGAEETFRAVGSAGGVHGEVRIGDSMLMMGGGIPGREFRSTPNTHALHIYVEDADAVCEKALAAGATSIDEPRDQEYGERSASVKDPAGNYWYIATHKGESYIPKGLNNVNVYLASATGRTGNHIPEARVRGAGNGEVLFAGRRGTSRGNSRRRFGGGDGRGSREISTDAGYVLSVRSRLRCRVPTGAGGGSDFDLGTDRPALRRPKRRREGRVRQHVVCRDSRQGHSSLVV